MSVSQATPAAARDVSVQARLVEQLGELQRERRLARTFITDNLAVVRSIAQHVVVLERGRVVESGATEHLLTRLEHAYTKQFLADLPRFGAQVTAAL